jgi:hypothetical protein
VNCFTAVFPQPPYAQSCNVGTDKIIKGAIMKRHIIRCSLIILLVGLVVLTPGRVNAQSNQHIELLSYSFGMIQGQTARISITLPRLAKPQLPGEPISARIQLLDTEGEVIAQSSEIKVAEGQTRFWDVPHSQLPASREPGERNQLRARILVTTLSADRERPSVMPQIEVIDDITGGTVLHAGKRFLIFVTGPTIP